MKTTFAGRSGRALRLGGWFGLALGCLGLGPLRADLNGDLAFTAFANVDLNRLAGGDILQSRGGLLDFQHGISTQSLYLVPATPAEVKARLRAWNPARHAELKVWMHEPVSGPPGPGSFPALQSLPDNGSVNALVDATARLAPGNLTLQVSRAEAALAPSLRAQNPEPRALFGAFWGQVLAGRVAHFLGGSAGNDAYDNGDTIKPLHEIRELLRSDPKVFRQFQRLIAGTPAGGGSASGGNLYYECFDVQGFSALGAGAVFTLPAGEGLQSADFEYFVCSGIYASAELDQTWPVTLNGQSQTLVWRQDLISTANIAYLHGTERLASGMIMLQDVKQVIEAFRSEFQ